MVIVSTYYGPTNTRGAKIKVKSHGFPAKFYSYDHAKDNYRNRVEAVDHYALTVIKTNAMPMTIGCLDDNAKIHGY
jgi:hypothetical protein